MRPGVVDRLGVGYAHAPRAQSAAHLLLGDRLRLRRPLRRPPGLRSPAAGDGRRHDGAGLRRAAPVLAHRAHRLLHGRARLPGDAGRAVRARAHGRGQRVETSLLQRRAGAAVRATSSTIPGKPTLLSRDADLSPLPGRATASGSSSPCGNQSFWAKLCKALGREDFADDPRFGSWLLAARNNADALHAAARGAFGREAARRSGCASWPSTTSRPRR